MSLDVYLTMEDAKQPKSGSGIYIRENGQTKEITRAEWDERFPDREPATAVDCRDDNEVYWANITHNLNKMADEAGIYYHLWQPGKVGVRKAKQLVKPLRKGLKLLESDPKRFKVFNPENGWGTYEGLIRFVRNYLAACEKYPEADVRASR